jgi:hypothetical protein
MESIRIPIQFTLEDWRAYQRVCATRMRRSESVPRQWLRILLIAGTTVLLLFLATLIGIPVHGWSLALGAGVVLLSIIINSRVVMARVVPDPDGKFFEPHECAIEPGGIRVTGAHSSTFTAWSDVREVTFTDQHLLLWIDRFQAHIIPVRALPPGVTRESLLGEIRRLQGAVAASAPLSAQASSTTGAPVAALAPARSFGTWLVTLASLLALRGKHVEPPARGAAWVVAGLSLATIGVWIALEWLKNQPSPEFYPYGISGGAWYGLAILAVAYVIARVASPRIGYAGALVLLLTVAPFMIAADYVVAWHLEGWWCVFGAVTTFLYFIAYLARGTAVFSGRFQPLAAGLGFFASLGLLVATDLLWVYPTVWYQLDLESQYEPTEIEPLLFSQPARVERALASVQPGKPEEVDVFFVGFAGYGEQRVFSEEIRLAAEIVGERYGAAERIVLLLNDARDQESAPLATTSTLRYALDGIAARMDVDEDILFLALSSHGSEDWRIAVSNGMLPLTDLGSGELKALLDESGIKWRILAVSACYAGGFVNALQDPYTIVLAAASPERTSFGCSDDRELTYFGEALYRDALPRSTSLRDAFATAQELIAQRESAEGIVEQSEPIAYFGAEIEAKLAELEAERPGSGR